MAPAPVAVSPLIKFARYSALLVGIAYGSRHNKTLETKEAYILDMKAKAKEAQEKKVEQATAAAAAGGEGSIFD